MCADMTTGRKFGTRKEFSPKDTAKCFYSRQKKIRRIFLQARGVFAYVLKDGARLTLKAHR